MSEFETRITSCITYWNILDCCVMLRRPRQLLSPANKMECAAIPYRENAYTNIYSGPGMSTPYSLKECGPFALGKHVKSDGTTSIDSSLAGTIKVATFAMDSS